MKQGFDLGQYPTTSISWFQESTWLTVRCFLQRRCFPCTEMWLGSGTGWTWECWFHQKSKCQCTFSEEWDFFLKTLITHF